MSGEHLRSRYGDGNERIGGTRPREAYQRPATEPTPSERTGRVREVRRRREPTVRQVPADATRPTSGDAHHDTQCEHHVQSQKLTRFIAGPTRPLPHHVPQQHSPVTYHVQSPGYSDFLLLSKRCGIVYPENFSRDQTALVESFVGNHLAESELKAEPGGPIGFIALLNGEAVPFQFAISPRGTAGIADEASQAAPPSNRVEQPFSTPIQMQLISLRACSYT